MEARKLPVDADATASAQTQIQEAVPSNKFVRNLQKEVRKLRLGGDLMDLFGDPVPSDLLTEYPIEDLDSQLGRTIQKKYKSRPGNTKRCWNRVQLLLPELMHHDGPKQRVLEMSTAHGGMLEVLRHFGHEVVGNDYVNLVSTGQNNSRALYRDVNDPNFERDYDDYGLPVPKAGEKLYDWPYRKIIESIDLPMSLFDAGQVPYPHEAKEFDVLICMQAIEHYCHPKDWMTIVDEFCRITRKTVILLLNPMLKNMGGAPRDYAASYRQAKMDLRSYRRNGFACSSCHMLWGEPAGFKLTAE
ncbi:MAG: hypothetical protein AAFW87_02610 [Pseudomonadota bacterium]